MNTHIRIMTVLRTLLLGFTLIGFSAADPVDWSMTLTPQSAVATSNEVVDFLITFSNSSTQDIFFSDFGDGQGITINLGGNVVGNGACGAGDDCFSQNLFLTSPDPIDIPASTSLTFDLGDLILGTHPSGDQIAVIVKGGPDSLNGIFPNPALSETTATVTIIPEPSCVTLLMSCFAALVCWRTRVNRYKQAKSI